MLGDFVALAFPESVKARKAGLDSVVGVLGALVPPKPKDRKSSEKPRRAWTR